MVKAKGGVNHVITREYQKLRGFSTDSKYARPAYVSDILVNMFRQADGTFGPRRGYQAVSSKKGGLGLTTFENPCRCSTEIITIDTDGSLYVTQQNYLTITYTGSSSANYLSYEIFVDPTTVSDPQNCQFNPYDVINPIALVNDRIKSRFYLNGSTVPTLDLDFGKGYGVAFPYTISDFITAVNTIPGTVAVPNASSDTSTPAAFLDVTERTNIPNGITITLNWTSWIKAHQTIPAPFAGLAAEIDSADFINATFANYKNTLYICTPYSFPQKYDGQTVFRAGMPEGEQPSAVVTATPGNPNGTYRYNITYEQDGRIINGLPTGFIVEGVLSDPSANTVTGGTFQIDVTVDTLIAGSGWNTNCAIINGNQVAVNTIVVQPTSTINTADTAFFLDSGGNEQTREVTAATATTITIAGTPVTVNNGDVISNNLKINIWRNENGLFVPRLLKTIPNNSFSATTTITDDISDTVLATRRAYPTPARQPNPPPIAAYVVNYRNQLIFTGIPDEDTVYYSEGDNPEYVPQVPDLSNSFLLPSNDDSITGAGIAGSTLIIFKGQSIYGISGDLLSQQFNVTPIAAGLNIGCVAHATIVEVGGLLYFLHETGLYSLSETSLYPTDREGNPISISVDIDKRFIEVPLNYNRRFQFIRAVAVNYTQDHQYLLFIPCEQDPSSAPMPKVANTYSRVLCYDYEGKDWFEWTNVNAASGFVVLDKSLYFMDRQFSATSTSTSNLYRQHRKYRLIDYVDHVTPIRATWRSSWEDGGQPKVRKKFIRSVLLFDDIDNERQDPNPVMCFRTRLDFINELVDTIATVTLAKQTAAWSTTPWAFSPWDGYQDSFYVINLKQGTVTKAMQVELQMNKLNQTFNLQGFQLEISPDFLQTVVR